MRLLVIGDTHFHNWKNQKITKYQMEFLRSLKTIAKDKNVNGLVFLGDIFESRKVIDKFILSEVVSAIGSLAERYFIILVTGNHDYYDSEVSVLEKLFSSIKNTYVITSPKVITFSRFRLGFLPWPYWSDKDVLSVMPADYIFSHVEIKGVPYKPGDSFAPSHGLTLDKLERLIIFNGHYHIPFVYNNVYFVGSIFQTDISEANYQKRIILLDMEEKFIESIDLQHPVYRIVTSLADYSYAQSEENVIPYMKIEKTQAKASPQLVGSKGQVVLKSFKETIANLVKEYAKLNQVDETYGLDILEKAYDVEVSNEAKAY